MEPGTEQEVFDLQGLIDAFDLSKVSKSRKIRLRKRQVVQPIVPTRIERR